MKYKNIEKGMFLERKNRFIAVADIDGVVQEVHVKNTGRCHELLVSGAVVYLEEGTNPNRKTKYDLIWSVSLIMIGIATLILSGSRIIGIELSDTVVRILGIIDLISLPFLVFTSIKKFVKKS